MRFKPGEQQRFVTLRHVCPAAAAARDEARPHRGRGVTRVEPLREGFPDHGRRRAPLACGVQAKIAFDLGIEEDGRALHMMYYII